MSPLLPGPNLGATSEFDLNGKRVFADVIKLWIENSSYWIRVDPQSMRVSL